jgi:hypothetical protein
MSLMLSVTFESIVLSATILEVILLKVFMLNGIMLNVFMLNVLARFQKLTLLSTAVTRFRCQNRFRKRLMLLMLFQRSHDTA